MLATKSNGDLLIVDDEINILKSLERIFAEQGYAVFTALNAKEAMTVLEQRNIDVIISDMRMPGMDGAELLKLAADRRPEVKRLLLTGFADMNSTIKAINEGKIDYYITKPWDNEQVIKIINNLLETKHLQDKNHQLQMLLEKQNEELKILNHDLEAKVAERTEELQQTCDELSTSYDSAIQLLLSIVELNEGKLQGHCRQIANHAALLAEALNLSPAEIKTIKIAGMLYNLGKMGLPQDLATKPIHKMNHHESIEYKKYPLLGATVLSAFPPLRDVADTVLHHREYYNGNGFPDNLKGKVIPLGARILSLVVDYHELQQGLIDAEKYSANKALVHIMNERHDFYDPVLTKLFKTILSGQADEALLLTEDTLVPGELMSGMVLSRDLHSQNGFMLLAKGQVLSHEVIEKIRSLNDEDLKIYVAARDIDGA